ncbi:hypothetical protein V6N11_037750 [Hibiscus sabdariffa]|uniref:Uncharacterized protein n=2 Tax=Hibiscus sabdariffa TaxID=183260 RepID=A0ABR2PER9_9ROSI
MVDGNGNRRWSWFESVLLMLVVLCIAVTIPLAATAPSDEGSQGEETFVQPPDLVLRALSMDANVPMI